MARLDNWISSSTVDCTFKDCTRILSEFFFFSRLLLLLLLLGWQNSVTPKISRSATTATPGRNSLNPRVRLYLWVSIPNWYGERRMRGFQANTLKFNQYPSFVLCFTLPILKGVPSFERDHYMTSVFLTSPSAFTIAHSVVTIIIFSQGNFG